MNSLQKLIHIKGLTVQKLAREVGRGYHSVQKVVKGQRAVSYIQADIAKYLGLDPDQAWGVQSEIYLSRQIQKEIDRHAAIELRRIREFYLGEESKAA